MIVHGTTTLVEGGEVYDFGWEEWHLPVQFARIDATHRHTYARE